MTEQTKKDTALYSRISIQTRQGLRARVFTLKRRFQRAPRTEDESIHVVSLLFLLFLYGSLQLSKSSPQWPFPYNWSKFPAAWFGANATNWESDEQIEAIGKYSMAIFGWQHLTTPTKFDSVVYAQLAQVRLPANPRTRARLTPLPPLPSFPLVLSMRGVKCAHVSVHSCSVSPLLSLSNNSWHHLWDHYALNLKSNAHCRQRRLKRSILTCQSLCTALSDGTAWLSLNVLVFFFKTLFCNAVELTAECTYAAHFTNTPTGRLA